MQKWLKGYQEIGATVMISKQEVADYINANIETLLTAEEIKILEDSIKNHPGKYMITDILIEVFGDVSILTAIRDDG
tara:strand:- start:1287 stop:1517 length:231 start_codon:yes stop_codon:yes gene_type:complete